MLRVGGGFESQHRVGVMMRTNQNRVDVGVLKDPLRVCGEVPALELLTVRASGFLANVRRRFQQDVRTRSDVFKVTTANEPAPDERETERRHAGQSSFPATTGFRKRPPLSISSASMSPG